MKKGVILYIFLSLLIIFTGCSTLGGPGPENPEKWVLNLLPENTGTVLFLEMDRANELSIFRDVILEGFDEGDKSFQEIKAAGIDLFSDIDLVSMVFPEAESLGDFDEQTPMIFFFHLNEKAQLFMEYIRAENGITENEEYKGTTLFKKKLQASDAIDTYCLLENAMIIMGPGAQIKSIVDNSKSKKRSHQPFVRFTMKHKEGNPLFWGGGILPPVLMAETREIYPGIESLESFETAALYVDEMEGELSFKINIQGEDKALNKKIIDVLNGFLLIAGLTDSDDEFSKFINSVSVEVVEEGIQLEMRITRDLIDTLREGSPDEFFDVEVDDEDWELKQSNV